MFEPFKHPLLIEEREPLDEHLRVSYEVLQRQSPATYDQLKVLKGINEVLRDRFFASGRTETPNLCATQVKENTIAGQVAAWLDFKQEVISSDTEPAIKQAYRWAVNEAIANAQMVRYSAAGNMRRFRGYNEFIYGQPSREIFAATVDWFRNDADELTRSQNLDVRQAAENVLELVPDLGGNRELLKPSPETFELIRQRHYQEGGYYALLLAGVELPTEGKVSKQVGDQAIRQVLQNIDSELDVIDAGGAAFAINWHKGAVESPADYNWVLKRFIGLPLAHEVGGHELEYQNGRRQKLRLFGVGLDRYEAGNEGREVLREQLPYDIFGDFAKTLRWQDIMRRHFAVSLGAGLSGQPMAFNETFAVLNAIDRLWERKKKAAETDQADAKADKRTWDLLSTKVYVGTDGSGDAVYMKNAVYLPGNVACWQAAEQSPELIEQGDLGKFDITNPRHIALAQRYGVLPYDQQ